LEIFCGTFQDIAKVLPPQAETLSYDIVSLTRDPAKCPFAACPSPAVRVWVLP